MISFTNSFVHFPPCSVFPSNPGWCSPRTSSASFLLWVCTCWMDPHPLCSPCHCPSLVSLQIFSPGSPLLRAFLEHLPYVRSITLSNSSPHFLHSFFLTTYFHVTDHYHSFVRVQLHATCLPLGKVNIVEVATLSH